MFEFEPNERAFIITNGAKEQLRLGPDGMVLTLHNLTPEEKAVVLQRKEFLESIHNIKIVVEEEAT